MPESVSRRWMLVSGPAGRRVRFLCAPLLVFAAALHAQQSPQPGNCRLDRGPSYGQVIPILPPSSRPELDQRLKVAFRQFYVLNKTEDALLTSAAAAASAGAAGDRCGLAMSRFLPAIAASDASAAPLLDALSKEFAEAGAPTGQARIQLRLANLAARNNKFDLAVPLYQAAERLFLSAGDAYGALNVRVNATAAQRTPDLAGLDADAAALHAPCLQAEVHETWGMREHNAGRLDSSTQQAILAISLFEQCPGSETTRAGLQTDLGRMEREQGRPFAALEHYRLALALQVRSGDLSYVPQTYNAMAVAYENAEDFRHAIPLFRKGLLVARQIHSQPFIDFLEANLGSAYSASGRTAEAIPLLERTTKDLTSEYLRCVRLDQLGKAYSRVGRSDDAIATLHVSLTACRDLKQIDRTLNTLEDLAAAELTAHHYEASLGYARENIALVEQTRAHVIQKDAYKQGFLNQQLDPYHYAIAALTALGRPAEALEVAEQARARAFLDLLASRPEETSPPDPHSLMQYRKDLIESPASIAPLTFDAMLQATGRIHSTLLAYWLSKDTLYIWLAVAGKPVLEATRPITRARLAALVAATHPRSGSQSNAKIWRTLYGLLIAPVASQLPRSGDALVTIVPSGPLFALSFAGLTAPNGTYLAEQFRTHTIPSVGLLAFTQHNAESAAMMPSKALFVDNPGRLPGGLAPLPGTAVEVDSILKNLPSGGYTRLQGAQASATRLRQQLPESTTIHFATHAVLNDADPYASYLALDDSAHDGRLTVADIYALHLNSRLVVLSACSSGLGKVTGDGVDGMSRAFFYAGSAAVLNTLWDIADGPTAQLLPRFYAALARGTAPSAALRTAQLSMLNDLRHHRIRTRGLTGWVVLPPDPLYWAAFSLAGEP